MFKVYGRWPLKVVIRRGVAELAAFHKYICLFVQIHSSVEVFLDIIIEKRRRMLINSEILAVFNKPERFNLLSTLSN